MAPPPPDRRLRRPVIFIAGEAPTSEITKKLDHLVLKAREHKEWRLEYVTLLERDEKMKEQGREEERKNTLLEAKRADEAEQRAEAAKQDAETKRQETLAVSIVNLMNNLRITMDQAMDALGIPASERNGYASLVDKLSEEASPSTNFTRSRKDWPHS